MSARSSTATESEDQPRVVAVAGGKGGSGKSLLAANIGIFLATLGKRVVLVDAALGSANSHIFAGLARPERTLSEIMGKVEVDIAEIISITPLPGLRLIAGVRDPAWVAAPKTAQIKRLISRLRDIDADYVVLDLSSGTAGFTLDLFLDADVGVLISVPEPTSVELCYRFIRCAFMRRLRAADLGSAIKLSVEAMRNFPGGIPAPLDLYMDARERDPAIAEALEREILDFTPHLVINGARSKADMEMGRAIAGAGRRRLGVPMTYLGHLEYDEAVWVAVRRRRPLLVEHPESRVSKCIERVTRRLLSARDTDRSGSEVVARDSFYDLLEVAPTASFEDIRRANRRVRDIYGRESVVISGLYSEQQLDDFHRMLDNAYTTLMDASKRKEYDAELFPDGVPSQAPHRPIHNPVKVEVPPRERPPMPELSDKTEFTGPLLQQIREAQGIELREIAERTKIGMAYLTALEGEVFKKLPAVVYVRGFLVEYAKMLAIDPDRVLETYLEKYRAERSKLEEQEESWP